MRKPIKRATGRRTAVEGDLQWFLDGAAVVGPFGPFYVGVGPVLPAGKDLAFDGSVYSILSFQSLFGFMFGSRDQVQLTSRAQPGAYLDGGYFTFSGLAEIGFAF